MIVFTSRYLVTITTPTIMPSTVGPYDTYVLETPSLVDGAFKLVAYVEAFVMVVTVVTRCDCL